MVQNDRGLLLLLALTFSACMKAEVPSTTPSPEPPSTPAPAPPQNPPSSQVPETPPEKDPPEGWQPRMSSDWKILEIEQFEVLTMNRSQVRGGDPNPSDFAQLRTRRLCSPGSSRNKCLTGGPFPDLVVNGSFYDSSGYVMGVTLRRGLVDNPVDSTVKYYGRGAVAQLSDGSFALCSPPKFGPRLDEEAIDTICGKPGAEVVEFLHGGALLVKNGTSVCSDGAGIRGCDLEYDLYRHQKFDNGGRGLAADQMRATQHTVLAEKEGRLFVAWPRDSIAKSGRQIRDDFLNAGFQNVLKFDGGSGFFVRGDNIQAGKGSNRSGLLIKLKH